MFHLYWVLAVNGYYISVLLFFCFHIPEHSDCTVVLFAPLLSSLPYTLIFGFAYTSIFGFTYTSIFGLLVFIISFAIQFWFIFTQPDFCLLRITGRYSRAFVSRLLSHRAWVLFVSLHSNIQVSIWFWDAFYCYCRNYVTKGFITFLDRTKQNVLAFSKFLS